MSDITEDKLVFNQSRMEILQEEPKTCSKLDLPLGTINSVNLWAYYVCSPESKQYQSGC